jgi:hypothetical protein
MTPLTVQQAPPAPPSQQPKIVPEMPRIPGVNDSPKPPRSDSKPLIAVIVVVILFAGGFALWLSRSRHVAEVKTSALTQPAAEPAISTPPAKKVADADPEAIATLDELAKPWASKKFKFVDPKTHESVSAMVIHLPASGARDSFWAFSLNTPFSQCELEYVTDLAALSQRYAYPATHPMVSSDCDGTLYDPLRMATLSDGAWVRGEIVRGGGIRPPVAIQVHLRGRALVADRIE